jgi:hypothetical protein
MLPESTIWNILQDHVPHGQWVSMREILSIVETHTTFDSTDLQAYRVNALTPSWRMRVKHLLEEKKKAGKIQGRKRS